MIIRMYAMDAINVIHEKWSKNKIVDENKPNKCDKCHKYNNIYYHLESDD